MTSKQMIYSFRITFPFGLKESERLAQTNAPRGEAKISQQSNHSKCPNSFSRNVMLSKSVLITGLAGCVFKTLTQPDIWFRMTKKSTRQGPGI